MDSKGAVILFLLCKYPIKGKVKTRLAAKIGDEGACRVAEAFILDILHKFNGIKSIRKVVFFTPSDSLTKFKKVCQG